MAERRKHIISCNSPFNVQKMKSRSEFIIGGFDMYFKRKIDEDLDSWLKEKGKSPALIG